VTSIERTAYPRWPKQMSKVERDECYGLVSDELTFVKSQAQTLPHQIILAALLKTFQNLGHFPPLDDIPEAVIRCIGVDFEISIHELGPVSNTPLYRYHSLIRDYLNVRSYREGGQEVATLAVTTAAETMNDPADLINAAIEELVRHRFKLALAALAIQPVTAHNKPPQCGQTKRGIWPGGKPDIAANPFTTMSSISSSYRQRWQR
jgi:Domain of unknown function (DUF4158)